jgi:hypothetical protein
VYQFLKSLTARQLLARQVPALGASVIVAEVFYKFHSFTLECGAFLVTWFVIDALAQFVASLLPRPVEANSATAG